MFIRYIPPFRQAYLQNNDIYQYGLMRNIFQIYTPALLWASEDVLLILDLSQDSSHSYPLRGNTPFTDQCKHMKLSSSLIVVNLYIFRVNSVDSIFIFTVDVNEHPVYVMKANLIRRFSTPFLKTHYPWHLSNHCKHVSWIYCDSFLPTVSSDTSHLRYITSVI